MSHVRVEQCEKFWEEGPEAASFSALRATSFSPGERTQQGQLSLATLALRTQAYRPPTFGAGMMV